MAELNEKKHKKKGLIIGSIIIVILIIIGFISYFTFRESTVIVDTSHTVGDSVDVGPYNITIKKVKNTQTLGKTILTKNQTDNNFFVVYINALNTSDKGIPSLDLSKNILTLTSNGKTYKIDDPSTMQAAENNLTSYLTAFSAGQTLTPKVNYSIPIIFETEGPIKTGDLNLTIDNQQIDYKI